MEIVKRGIPPDEEKFRVLCNNCKSELIVQRKDAVAVRGFGKLIFICPVCYVRFLIDGVYK